MSKATKTLTFCTAAITAASLFAFSTASATHSWGNYHWKRIGTLNLTIGDNVSSTWDSVLNIAVADWNLSSALNLTKEPGTTNPKNCKAVTGTVQVCNSNYGFTGWLGIAQIWLSGEHITKGITKLNDSYFASAPYNTPAWRSLVTCQEIGHDFGLDHQDENFDNANLGTCMDYTSNPIGNEHPNTHD